jgi:hypothetical protein
MGRIFKNADMVLAWLGKTESLDGVVAFDFIRRSLTVFESDIHHFHDSEYFDQHQLAVNCLSRVFENPWFTRAWIAQEVGLASQATIVLGEAELDLRRSVKTTVWMSSALKLPAYFESGHFAEFLVMVHMWTELEGFV